jgi:transposase
MGAGRSAARVTADYSKNLVTEREKADCQANKEISVGIRLCVCASLTGKSFWLILPTVNTILMNMALKEFSQYVDPKNEKIIVLLMDGAGWHRSHELNIPKNVRIVPLPPYSPELQPVECSWPLLKESVANTHFDSLDVLENTISKRCQWLLKNPETLKGAVGFNWIQVIESGRD